LKKLKEAQGTLMKSVKAYSKSQDADTLQVQFETQERPVPKAGECLIEVKAAAVNPSDVKALLGLMPHAVWPRTPGRDYAGVVIDGASEMIGREVWGSGGELGIRRDGTHARYLVVSADSVQEKPANLTMQQAASVGVPFVTAFEGLQRAGGVKPGDVVLVLAANGKVGQAATQLALRAGARVFGAQRGKADTGAGAGADADTKANPSSSHERLTLIDSTTQDIAEVVRAATDGHGADIVFNTVGSPYFAQGNQAMAILGRQIFIATVERPVPFDIFTFYRGRHTYVGIDSLALSSVEGAQILAQLKPDFENGSLAPFPISADAIFPLERAVEAYRQVLKGSSDRVVLAP
jgi:NADPH2:quinone reductase